MKHLLAIFLISIFLDGICSAQDSFWNKKRAPKFDDFHVSKIFSGKPVTVKLSSHPNARRFRTRLRSGAKEGPNFAGHYTVVEWGCGSNCQNQMLVDAVSGKVYDTVDYTERGAEFRLNSRLYIVNPSYSADTYAYPDDPTANLPVRYYVLEGNKLKLIYEESCSVLNRKQICVAK